MIRRVLAGDCLTILKTFEADSVDSIITDPPAGISFMGKSWDSDKGGRDEWVKWMAEVMSECLRVLKPGGHALVWAIPRTSHWTATAVENAGLEVRDVVTHLFGSGFPKSLNIEKATDGAVKGQGTALKPAAEFWILARKPLSEKTVAKNVLKWGTGGLNIDGSRIEGKPRATHGDKNIRTQDNLNGRYGGGMPLGEYPVAAGRFPANLVLSGDIPEMLGDVARFFYCAKVSPSERNAGLEGMPDKAAPKFDGGDFMGISTNAKERVAKNNHPTVKPIKLMAYLIKLITPPGGLVLDPFTGSGSTGVAALQNGFRFIGIEREAEYVAIAEKRMEAVL